MTTPADLLRERRIVVCVGCGGVGKTTGAAAIALEAARRGRRALVVTIDPARRLADALGVDALGNTPSEIPRERLTALGVPAEGSLAAMMLDMKRTFDDLVTRFSENDAARDRVLANPIYQHVSDALAGSAEYSAMEKVYELTESGVADLIVLDTPPSQHAIEFLEAPERLLAFLESPVVQLLFHPAFAAGRMGMRLFQRGTVAVLRTIERVAGIGFLEDISEFLLAFEGMAEGFRERARAVQALLVGPDAAFVLASGPAPESVAQAGAFLDRLEVSKIRVAGLLLNRMHLFEAEPPPLGVLDEGSIGALTEALAADAEPGYPARKAAEAAISALRSYAAMVDRDRRATEPLIARAGRAGIFHRRIPEFDGDVHDLEGLLRIASYIFPSGEDA